ncbi:molybdopterin-dependent oxidoreductase [Xanthobacter tagetidis]|uniref:Asp-tRNA(Asn)/Glu-tRNA(Gln) amidotransferase GatCAB subunit C n=1 Tax=Xanthobacter tagetidis TaxID=60216 RepID=A0A3L7A4M6_9HYPH|nr:molybdopterin-dependent oxidoreductase [Xanthobacter tagetidis]MBB6308849.1 biotin/methionine sulfoxide reductase [Xanthobacter tagetidis]RLP74898.1 Asp-tRNA(Asn)/Glu-tRNA(Gln) amidotransferase GatCAB subunit C [Xanthobacter tagetidis]
MLPTPRRPTVTTHWGIYRAAMADGRAIALDPFEGDPDPSPIAQSMLGALDHPCRILRPAVRRSFLERGAAATGAGRGAEPFVEVDWPQALDLVARELDRVRHDFGNSAIFGGSYGWASAGRFHHAQSQIHRFLNTIGGYTRSFSNYSHGAADVIVPHVVGERLGLHVEHTPWRLIAGHAELIVMFGGIGAKNAQVSSGGIVRHGVRAALRACREGGAELVSISPIRDDTAAEAEAEWMAPRPGTDVALMLALAHTLLVEDLCDTGFIERYTIGFERFGAYLVGRTDGVPKTAEWAQEITQVPAEDIRALARRMAAKRTFLMMSWSLQRADHGEQPYWMAIVLAAMLGQIGLPGGGYGFGFGSVNGIGNPIHDFAWPSLPQGDNPVPDFIPVARIADMLLDPGGSFDFNGRRLVYPDIRLVYWAGGNPFHHHQDLNRLLRAWRRPETVIVHESWWNGLARHADIVLPAATQLERNDVACSSRDRMISASHKVAEPAGEARADFAIFAAIAERLGAREAFTEGRDEEAWLRQLYGVARQRTAAKGLDLPDFDTFWREGIALLPEAEHSEPTLAAFRRDPAGNALRTPSGRIEIFSQSIAAFGYDDCPGHPAWIAPKEWLGAPEAERYPLHLISSQPATKLHSQYDLGAVAQAAKIKGREPVRIHPDDAAARGIGDGDIVRIFNGRGACLAAAVLSAELRPGVVQLATGAWFDPVEPGVEGVLEKHGNPNVLTADRGTSRLGQGCAAHSCLVEMERFDGAAPPVTCFDPPAFAAGRSG